MLWVINVWNSSLCIGLLPNGRLKTGHWPYILNKEWGQCLSNIMRLTARLFYLMLVMGLVFSTNSKMNFDKLCQPPPQIMIPNYLRQTWFMDFSYPLFYFHQLVVKILDLHRNLVKNLSLKKEWPYLHTSKWLAL